MAISKQVHHATSGSHVGGHPCHNAAVPTHVRSASHVTENQPSQSRSSSANQATSALIQKLKIPVGHGPYVRAKQAQLVERDPEQAISLFWAAISLGDRVDSALKDMVVVMKQQNRGEEAIQAILSFRHLCSALSQESLDNLLLDLYKKCGRLDDQIELLKHKLNLIHKGLVFNGKRTKTARSQGRKFQLSVRQEITRLLGNLGWSYMQLCNYVAAEAVYRKALSLDADNNKLYNLGVCLSKQGKLEDARMVLEQVSPLNPDGGHLKSESQLKSFERSRAFLRELCAQKSYPLHAETKQNSIAAKEFDPWTHWQLWEAPALNFKHKPAVISTNPALNHRQISSSDWARTGHALMSPEMPDTTCDSTDDLTAALSPKARCHRSPFKREIGPPDTVQQARAKKNTHGTEKIDGGTHTLASDNYSINSIDACWCSSNGWPSRSSSCHEPVARRLFLGMESDSDSFTRVHADGNALEEWLDARYLAKGGDTVINDKSPVNVCTYDTSFNGGAQENEIDDATLDFSCVDKVIASIVPDAPSASQATVRTCSTSDRKGNDANGAVDMPTDELFPHRPGHHAQHMEASQSQNGVQQHRLRIFQEMTD